MRPDSFHLLYRRIVDLTSPHVAVVQEDAQDSAIAGNLPTGLRDSAWPGRILCGRFLPPCGVLLLCVRVDRPGDGIATGGRSEERRVGKECRSRREPKSGGEK